MMRRGRIQRQFVHGIVKKGYEMRAKYLWLCLGVAAAVPAAAQSGLQNENLLVPMPAGFKVGSADTNDGTRMTEYILTGETVDDWSRMITEVTLLGRGGLDPDGLPTDMAEGWKSACEGARVERVANAQDNGYPSSVWVFACPNNPQTGKPETMYMKVIAGNDSLYSLQYAFRQTLSREMTASAMDYLKKALVCDTRQPEHPCPKGMKSLP